MNEYQREAHRRYIEALRRLTPEQRLQRAFELSQMTIDLFTEGLRQQYPDLPEDEFQKLWRERLAKCHNRNW